MKNNIFLKKIQKNCNMKLELGLTIVDLDIVLKSVAEVVAEELGNGEKVKLPNIGSFYIGKKNARRWRNPKTGVEMRLAEKHTPLFSMSDTLKRNWK